MHALILALMLILMSFSANAQTTAVCDQVYPVTVDGSTLYQRYCGNVDLQTVNYNITELHVYLHGVNVNAQDYMASMMDAVRASGKQNRIAAIGPQFIRSYTQGLPFHDEDDVAVGGTLDLNGTHADNLYYGTGWPHGDQSFTGSSEGWTLRPVRISSYQAMDALLVLALQKYPNIKQMKLLGHSAGGQFMNRYTLAANIPPGFPNNNIFFMTTNPSSSAYFTNQRPDIPVDHPVTFSTPTESCPGYDTWRYGLVDVNANGVCDDCNNYLSTIPYSTLINNFKLRNHIRGMSLDDIDPLSVDLDQTCGGTLQGDHRMSRAEAYMEHVINYHGWEKWVRNYEPFYIPNCAHSFSCAWKSTCGLYILYGQNSGSCATPHPMNATFNTTLSGWTKTGTGNFTLSTYRRVKGSAAARMGGIMDNMIVTSDVMNVSGVHTISWGWWLSSTMDNGDTVAMQLSIDGGSWTTLDELEGNVDPENRWLFNGTSINPTTSLQLRLVGNASRDNEYVLVDEVKVVERRGL